jgi:ATP-binding cassette subfamily B protein
MAKFPFYRQHDSMDCGPTCLRMIAKHYGKSYSLEWLRENSYIDREGVSLEGISDAAEAIGFHTLAVKIDYKTLVEDMPLPCIAHWRNKHFVVVYKTSDKYVWVSDPATGYVKYTKKEFLDGWSSDIEDGEKVGIVLALETTPEFFQTEEEERIDKSGFGFLFSYAFRYKKLLVQLLLGLLFGSLLQLLFPFLTQAVVDVGINTNDIDFIYLILAAQLMLFLSQTSVSFIQSWILLHISTRMNISLISDFLVKLMRLPIGFFDSKMVGDLLQRISDNYRIESFLTATTLTALLSVINLFVFGVVLLYYNSLIFLIFAVGSILFIGWILFFLKKRKIIDYKKFDQQSANQTKLIQIINGMQEIKLQNAETRKRWEWERIQARLFKVNISGLALNQYQVAGSRFINELKNIFIVFVSAKLVIDGELTLGMMLAIQYIMGQLNGVLLQLTDFIHSAQDAKISLERLGEIHNKEDEKEIATNQVNEIPMHGDLKLENVTFNYGNPSSPAVLKNISLTIPRGKVTAIVGTSGSGKTTILKLLLKFYTAQQGSIKVGEMPISNINNRAWRSACGAVMQDGYIFSDTIANNIGISDEQVDKEKLVKAVSIACIQDFVEALPLGYNSKTGANGNGLSEGQKQRLLIARAVYKNPEYLFFDEATNSLDTKNEKSIVENLDKFFKDKTVIVVAHRLSTVKDADQIVVIDQGEIVEIGDHKELTAKKGAYFNLVKNQLELGG